MATKTALLGLALASALGGAIVAAPNLADRFIYHPRPLPAGWAPPPGTEEVALRTADGVRIAALFYPWPDARAAVLYLHGNAGNLTFWERSAARLSERARVAVLLLDYRGYGKSEGWPSEEGLYLDAEAGYDWLSERTRAPIVLYGHSLGTGVAVETALRRPAAALVLEAPFTAIPDVVEETLPFLDARKILSERYDNLEKAPRLRAPALIVHGTADRTIPVSHGRALARAAGAGADLLEVEGAGHVGAPGRAGDLFYERVNALIDRAIAPARSAASAHPGEAPDPRAPSAPHDVPAASEPPPRNAPSPRPPEPPPPNTRRVF